MGVLIDLDVQSNPIQQTKKQCASEINIDTQYLKIKNNLAEISSSKDKKEARDNLDIKADNIPYNLSDYENIKTVKDALDKLLRKPLSINYFRSDINVYDNGDYLSGFNLSWDISKQVDNLNIYINNNPIQITPTKHGSKNIPNRFLGNVNIRLVASTKDETVSSNITIYAVTPLYFGISNDYTKNEKILTASTSGTTTITANSDQYIYLMTPFQITQFVNGFEGGFEKLDPIDITTKLGNTVKYYVYRSDYKGLGKTTIQWQQK